MQLIRVLILLPIFAVVFLSGCAVSGDYFTVAEAPPADKSIVYFYRPKAFTAAGIGVPLLENDEIITHVYNGQFVKHVTVPGDHEFLTKTMVIDKALKFTAEAGETYFVRVALREGMWTGTWYLSRVYPEQALSELQKCCKGEQ